MKTRRLAGIAALSVAAASILAVPGASAQETTFGASSDGRALALSLFGEGLTAGLTHSEGASSIEGLDGPVAVATGTGIADLIAPAGQSAAADPTDALPEGATATEGEQCGGALPEGLAQLGLVADFACSTSTAAVVDGAPTSSASARVGSLALNPIGAINQTPLSEVVDAVEQEAVGPLLEGLAPLFQGIDEGTGLTTEDTLNDLFALLLNGAPLATITVGDTESTTTTNAEKVVTQCVAHGARIDVLDPAGVEVEGVAADAPPILSVIIGDVSTSVTVDRATADTTAEASPAIITVIAPLLGPDNAEISIGPGDAQVIPLPDPFGNIVISVAGTLEEDVEGGGKSVQASAVRIHLFEGSEELMNGVELALADCFSVAGATVALPSPSPAPTTTTPSLPRTGGSGPNGLAIAAAAAFAGLGLALLRRSNVS